jgi:hypothetical protein
VNGDLTPKPEPAPTTPGAAPSSTAGRAARAPRLLYREVLDSIDPDFDRAYALYERTFAPSKRISRDYFVVLLEAKRAGRLSPDNFRFLVCREDQEVVGLCTGRYLERLNVGFVGYLVVDGTRRQKRIGSSLRRHLIRGFQRDAQLAGHGNLEAAVGEVEPTNPWISILVGKGKVLALDIPYRQPSLRPGEPAVPLVLYWQPVATPEVPKSLPADRVRALVKEIFHSIYRIAPSDPCEVLQEILKDLEGKTEVTPRALKERPSSRRKPEAPAAQSPTGDAGAG